MIDVSLFDFTYIQLLIVSFSLGAGAGIIIKMITEVV
jgi:hypothetical protein